MLWRCSAISIADCTLYMRRQPSTNQHTDTDTYARDKCMKCIFHFLLLLLFVSDVRVHVYNAVRVSGNIAFVNMLRTAVQERIAIKMPNDCACVRFSSLFSHFHCMRVDVCCVCVWVRVVVVVFAFRFFTLRSRYVVFWFASVQFAIVCWLNVLFFSYRGSSASFVSFGFKANVNRVIICCHCFVFNTLEFILKVLKKTFLAISREKSVEKVLKLSWDEKRIGGFVSVAGEKP